MMNGYRILVIVVTYNAMKWANRCFSSLISSTLIPDIYVVDNGSTDGTQEFIKQRYPNIHFYQSDHNLGFGKANNMGLQYALDKGYDYVYLLNQDAWIFSDTLVKLIEISKKYSEYGVLSPFQMNADLINIDKYFTKNVCNIKACPNLLNDLYNSNISEVYPAKNVMAAHWFMTKKCLRLIGGFSPSFPHYGEDGNYEDRLYYKGLMMGIVPSLRVVHDRGGRAETPNDMMFISYTSCIREISRPNQNWSKTLFTVLFFSFSNIIRYKSFKPIIYLLKLCFHLMSILKDRTISMTKESAFLQV